MSQKTAIIGSGLSGSVLAYYLQKSTSVSLFEKSQGVSGRMSTRSFADFEFDHGAQFFTARSNKFNEFLLPYLEDRTVVEWKPKILEELALMKLGLLECQLVEEEIDNLLEDIAST